MECDSIITTTLVSMYGKCSSLDDAQDLFEKLATKEVATWNTLIDAFSTHGNDQKAISMFNQMQQEGTIAAKATFVSILGAVRGKEALSLGKQMHTQIVACGFLSDKVVTTALFGMYGSCESMGDAEDLFEGMGERTSTSWNAMISEHLQSNCSEKAFRLFDRMIWEGQVPDKVTYLNMLLACTLENTFTGGTIIHLQIVSSVYVSEVAVATALIAMYGKLEKPERAAKLFDSISERNIISWNCIVRVYAHCGSSKQTFQLLEQLKQEGSIPNVLTLTLCLTVCCNESELFKGKNLHVCVAHKSFESEPFLFNVLTSMYAKCGSLNDAFVMSESVPQKDIFVWNNLIDACAQKGLETLAFQIFNRMGQEGILPNVFTLIVILEACCVLRNFRQCQELHACTVQADLKEDASVASALVKAYGASGEVRQAWAVFEMVTNKDAVLWNSILSVYANQGHAVLILQLRAQMLQEGQVPTSITYVSLFSACAHSELLRDGMCLHSCIRHSELEQDISLMNSLIFMYGKCGFHEVSDRLLFEMPRRDRVSWSGLIAVYTEIGFSRTALQLYYQMVDQDGILPDTSTIVSILAACACGALLAEGKELHNHITFLMLDVDAEVINSLMNMYGKCGDLDDALYLFASLPKKDSCSWNTMITLLPYHGHDNMAIELFMEMLKTEVLPSEITFSSVLSSCGNIASLICGRLAHLVLACSEVEFTTTITNTLISMYGKCGSLKDAMREFTKLSARDTVSWNAIIFAYAQHGCGEAALKLLEMMQRAGSLPNEISFLTAILACSYAGLVDAGCFLWVSMNQDCKVKPGLEHFSCLVDTFSRAGQLFDAKRFLVNMPYQPCSASWTALLSACRDDVNVSQGLTIADYLLEMDPLELPTHIMLSNIQYVDVK